MSDYDRNKYYGKKKLAPQSKESSSSFGRSYYGRRSPSGPKTEKEPKDAKNEAPKLKQPTILLKAREHNEEAAVSPKKTQRENDVPPSTSTEVHSTPAVKVMTKSAKFLEDSVLFVDNIQEFVQDNSDFLVVGIVGPQSVGKSTILNLIAHNVVTDDLKRAIFKQKEGPQEEEYGDDNIRILTDNINNIKFSDDEVRTEIFKVQTVEAVETNSNTTNGIDLFVTSNRVILLDCQPCCSGAVLDDLIQSENKRSSIVSEFIALENSGEIQGLQLTAFLMSVCHVLILVQDYFCDSNLVRFIQTAEMLKPTHSNPEDELNDYFPHLLIVHNNAQLDDFTPQKFKLMQTMYNLFFQKTKLQKDSNLGLATCKLISYLNEESCGEPFNLFLIPDFNQSKDINYNGHPPLEDLVGKLRANILGAVKSPLTHVQLTEKTWLTYCSKVWENVRKSSFFVEYTKLMP